MRPNKIGKFSVFNFDQQDHGWSLNANKWVTLIEGRKFCRENLRDLSTCKYLQAIFYTKKIYSNDSEANL